MPWNTPCRVPQECGRIDPPRSRGTPDLGSGGEDENGGCGTEDEPQGSAHTAAVSAPTGGDRPRCEKVGGGLTWIRLAADG